MISKKISGTVVALGTAGPGTEIIFGANEENSSSYAQLKLLCITDVPCVSYINHAYRDVAKNLLFGEVRLNIPESAGGETWVSKTPRWLENTIVGVVCANTVLYKSTILLIFEAELAESVQLLYSKFPYSFV